MLEINVFGLMTLENITIPLITLLFVEDWIQLIILGKSEKCHGEISGLILKESQRNS